MQVNNTQLGITANLEPLPDLKVDLIADRQNAENYAENFRVNTLGAGEYEYEKLVGNNIGNFNISTLMIKTAFAESDAVSSSTFEDFKGNRLAIAQRLALARGIDINNPANLDAEGYPLGYGKNNQAVLLRHFMLPIPAQMLIKYH